MSDTPRTDAAAIEASGHCEDDEEGQAMVGIRFARQLERELAAAREECAKVCEANDLLNGSIGPLMNAGWALCQKACANAIRAMPTAI